VVHARYLEGSSRCQWVLISASIYQFTFVYVHLTLTVTVTVCWQLGMTGLMEASAKGRVNLVRTLLDMGVDLNLRNNVSVPCRVTAMLSGALPAAP